MGVKIYMENLQHPFHSRCSDTFSHLCLIANQFERTLAWFLSFSTSFFLHWKRWVFSQFSFSLLSPHLPFFLAVMEIKSRALGMLGEHSTRELHPQPLPHIAFIIEHFIFLLIFFPLDFISLLHYLLCLWKGGRMMGMGSVIKSLGECSPFCPCWEEEEIQVGLARIPSIFSLSSSPSVHRKLWKASETCNKYSQYQAQSTVPLCKGCLKITHGDNSVCVCVCACTWMTENIISSCPYQLFRAIEPTNKIKY